MLSFIAAALIVSGEATANRSVFQGISASADSEMPPEVLNWRGWNYLGGDKGKERDPFPVRLSAPTQSESKDAQALVWRERIVIFNQTEAEVRDSAGVVHSERGSMESAARARVQEAIAHLAGWVAMETSGHVKLATEVTSEPEPMRGPEFGAEFARGYLGPRINGGGYEAEDKVFRGPYNGVIYILPGRAAADETATWVNGMPVRSLHEFAAGAAFAEGDLLNRLHQTWVQEVGDRLESRLIIPSSSGSSPQDLWSEATSTVELGTDTRLLREQSPPKLAIFSPDGDQNPLLGKPAAVASSWKTSWTEAKIVPDNDRGEVLCISEKGVGRNGGFALPQRADGKPLAIIPTTPSLSLDLKSASKDPIGIRVLGRQNSVYFSLGTQWNPEGNAGPTQVRFVRDGTWQHVAIDLSKVSAFLGDEVVALEIRPTPSAATQTRFQAEPIDIYLDHVAFTTEKPSEAPDAPKPNVESSDPEERALFAARATSGSPALTALLSDKAEVVRLNAALALGKLKDATAESALENDANDLDPSVAEAALHAIAFQANPGYLDLVRKTSRVGITPLARATAVRILGKLKDAALGNDLVFMIGDRSRLCRLAAAESLAGLGGDRAGIFRMTFLDEEDPEIKLAVTESADPTDEYEMRKLLWSAVNEPSDLVRAMADIKLIQASGATFRTEGYKGVHDDSVTTRLVVLDYLGKHPSEENRAALRLAVTDRSPSVRAAALFAFGAMEKGVSGEEVANVMQDRDPGVQLALIALAKKSGLRLSDETRQLMATSPDARVKDALAGN